MFPSCVFFHFLILPLAVVDSLLRIQVHKSSKVCWISGGNIFIHCTFDNKLFRFVVETLIVSPF